MIHVSHKQDITNIYLFISLSVFFVLFFIFGIIINTFKNTFGVFQSIYVILADTQLVLSLANGGFFRLILLLFVYDSNYL